jgi:hypothetical protein
MAKSKKIKLPTLKDHVAFTQTVASSFIPVIKIGKVGGRAVGGIAKKGSKFVSKTYRNMGR